MEKVTISVNFKNILKYVITFFIGVLVAAAIIFIVSSSKTSNYEKEYNELKIQYEKLEEQYNLTNEKYNQDFQKLTESNQEMITKIEDIKNISTDFGTILGRQASNINMALQMIRDLRTAYQQQKEILNR